MIFIFQNWKWKPYLEYLHLPELKMETILGIFASSRIENGNHTWNISTFKFQDLNFACFFQMIFWRFSNLLVWALCWTWTLHGFSQFLNVFPIFLKLAGLSTMLATAATSDHYVFAAASMAEEVIVRVLQGQKTGDLYAVLGVEPSLGSDLTDPASRQRAFQVLKRLPLSVSKLQDVFQFWGFALKDSCCNIFYSMGRSERQNSIGGKNNWAIFQVNVSGGY